MVEISNRRSFTLRKTGELLSHLDAAQRLITGKACVYATGSYGRLEASGSSDLDLFIVGDVSDGDQKASGNSLLSHLDEICIKSDLIKATRSVDIKDFDGDGRYLVHYPVSKLTSTLGKSDDDSTNTFTSRLLLLLESKPLLGEDVYFNIVRKVLTAYWRDFDDHKDEFIPAYLTNDILRLWRTFCVNYEAKTERKPSQEKVKGKIKNFKLKHSRMLTCFSALIYLLAVYKQRNTVLVEDAEDMIRITPLERLEWIQGQHELVSAHDYAAKLVRQYEVFLEMTSIGESKLSEVFMNKEKSSAYASESRKFGNLMYDVLQSVGGDSLYYRMVVV